MRIPAIVISAIFVLSAGPGPATASDADTVAAINASSNALDAAFAAQDAAAIKALMTKDHLTVTPYYDGPQSVDDQIASLPDLNFGETIVEGPDVVLLAPDVALRMFTAELDGSFKGAPLPTQVFVNETLIQHDGKWIERFYQVTTLKE